MNAYDEIMPSDASLDHNFAHAAAASAAEYSALQLKRPSFDSTSIPEIAKC